MLVYEANVRHNPLMRASNVLHDLNMGRQWSVGGLAVYVEMQGFGRNYDALAREVYDPARYTIIGRRTEVSVVVDHDHWALLDQRTIKLTDGSKWIPQPDRWLVMALVRPLDQPTLPAFWFAGTHWTNGGYNGPRFKPHKAKRRELWDAQHAATAAAFGTVPESILWTGDVNREFAPKTHPHECVVLEHGIDTLRKIEKPGGARFHIAASRVVHGQRSDHAPLWARINLEPPVTPTR